MTPTSETPAAPPSENDPEVEKALTKLGNLHTWSPKLQCGVTGAGKYIYDWQCTVCWEKYISDEPPTGGCKGPPEPEKGYYKYAYTNYGQIYTHTVNTPFIWNTNTTSTSSLNGWEVLYESELKRIKYKMDETEKNLFTP